MAPISSLQPRSWASRRASWSLATRQTSTLRFSPHALANLAVGNDAGAACIELIGGTLSLATGKPLTISIDGGPSQRIAAGDRVTVSVGERLTSYLAIAAGIDVPAVLGPRSTLLVAGIGGFHGRGLQKGDALATGEPGARERVRVEPAERWCAPTSPR